MSDTSALVGRGLRIMESSIWVAVITSLHLGVEIPAARVPILQKQMIRKGLQLGKLVITATQMLD